MQARHGYAPDVTGYRDRDSCDGCLACADKPKAGKYRYKEVNYSRESEGVVMWQYWVDDGVDGKPTDWYVSQTQRMLPGRAMRCGWAGTST